MENNFLILLMNSIDVFFLIFARISGIFIVAPFFSRTQVPSFVKVGLNMIISYSILPFLIYQTNGNYDFIELLALFVREFTIGFLLGFTAQLFFNIFISAGANSDLQIGLSMAQMVDPSINSMVTDSGNLYTAFAYLLFFATNSHYLLIRGILNSFVMLPLGAQVNFQSADFLNYIVKIFLQFMESSILIMMPIMIVLFLGNILLAFMSKVMPQMNVFIVGMPFKIFAGFSIMVVLLPHLKDIFVKIFMFMSQYMYMLIRILSESK